MTIAAEQHYTPKQLADKWALGERTIIRMFENEPGVLIFGKESTSRRRRYRSLRIPESVAVNVHKKLHDRDTLHSLEE